MGALLDAAFTAEFDGCRDPAETSQGLPCTTCCNGDERGACQYQAVNLNGMSKQEQANWWAQPYHQWNIRGQKIENGVAQSCSHAFPDGCPSCATCSLHDEASFQTMTRPKSCDCATNKDVWDPCFAPQSCACFCQHLNDVIASCPHLKDQVASVPVQPETSKNPKTLKKTSKKRRGKGKQSKKRRRTQTKEKRKSRKRSRRASKKSSSQPAEDSTCPLPLNPISMIA